MKKAPIPKNEADRLKAVIDSGLLDSSQNKRFDKYTIKACEKFHVPISTITIIDRDTEHYISCQGLKENKGDRETSFCGHALASGFLFIVEDTLKDKRFKDNPKVVSFPYIRFYAGMVLRANKSNQFIGVFCIKDTKPRTMSNKESSDFINLAMQVEKEINESVSYNIR